MVYECGVEVEVRSGTEWEEYLSSLHAFIITERSYNHLLVPHGPWTPLKTDNGHESVVTFDTDGHFHDVKAQCSSFSINWSIYVQHTHSVWHPKPKFVCTEQGVFWGFDIPVQIMNRTIRQSFDSLIGQK